MRLGSVVLAISLAGPWASAADFKIVASENVKGTQVSRQSLVTIFMSGLARWGDGMPVIPVDQSLQSPVRQAFTRSVLGQPVGAVLLHWHELVRSGRGSPPTVKASDEEVLAYVARNRGAVGYVSGETAIPEGVKVLTLTQ